MTSLEEWLLNEKTNNRTTDLILQRITAWRDKDTLQPVTAHPALREAIAEQDSIGWENFLLGRVSTKFITVQQVHYTNIGSRKTGSKWATKLIRQLWLVVWKMWEHRNHINNTDLTQQQRRERAQLLGQVNQEFTKGRHGLQKEDRHLLRRKDDIVKYSLPELKEWVERVQHARATGTRQAEAEARSLRASQRCMARWRHGLTA